MNIAFNTPQHVQPQGGISSILPSWSRSSMAEVEVQDTSQVEEMDTSDASSHWAWYYLAECGDWHMFGSDPFGSPSVSSLAIEESYSRDCQGYIDLRTPKYIYRIDFKAMKQTNLGTGKQRDVKRVLQSSTSLRAICDSPAVQAPCHWEAVNTQEPFQPVLLSPDSHEYWEVSALFRRTMSSSIRYIHRIQNTDLWEFFCRKRAQMRRLKRGGEIEERMLFHGTPSANVKAICTFNFDWRQSGTNGSVYGHGSYFARDAKYSSKFCGPAACSGSAPYCMFLARVLVGEYTQGGGLFRRPPSKDGTLMTFYDSCVDDASHPKIFVIFDSNQVYPEYLIEFS